MEVFNIFLENVSRSVVGTTTYTGDQQPYRNVEMKINLHSRKQLKWNIGEYKETK